MPSYDYNKKYAKKYLSNLDSITTRLHKGDKDKIKAHAESMGESLNGFINRAIAEAMERDKAGAPGG